MILYIYIYLFHIFQKSSAILYFFIPLSKILFPYFLFRWQKIAVRSGYCQQNEVKGCSFFYTVFYEKKQGKLPESLYSLLELHKQNKQKNKNEK